MAGLRGKVVVIRRLDPTAIEAEVAFVPDGGSREGLSAIREGRIALEAGSGGKALSWAFGGRFAEVHVHGETGEIRVARLLGAFAAGRVLNPLTAHSQFTGAMIGAWARRCWRRRCSTAASTATPDLAEYLVATAADAPDVQALLLPDVDAAVNPLGVKGLGELGIIGVNAASQRGLSRHGNASPPPADARGRYPIEAFG